MLYKHLTYSETKIAIWKTTETVGELWELLHNKDFYFSDFQKLKTEKRQKEWLVARILVEMLCGSDKTITYNENGKPFLTDHSYKISISHTLNYVALVAHPMQEVGIDIESFGKKILHVKERFLSAEELQHIDKENETAHLLLHWCAKETIYKMQNQNVDFREQIPILPFIPQQNGKITCHCGLAPQSPEKHTLYYNVEKDFVMVWNVK